MTKEIKDKDKDKDKETNQILFMTKELREKFETHASIVVSYDTYSSPVSEITYLLYIKNKYHKTFTSWEDIYTSYKNLMGEDKDA